MRHHGSATPEVESQMQHRALAIGTLPRPVSRRRQSAWSVALTTGVATLLSACGAATPSATEPPPPTSTVEESALASTSPVASPSSSTTAPSTGAVVARWSELDGAGGPPAREDHTWTVVGDGSTALLFGGRDGSTVYGDLWAFDLQADAWTSIETGGGPAARFGHEAVWVDGIGLVVFAGQGDGTFFNDLWAFDTESGEWTLLPSTGDVPVARYGTCLSVGPDGRLWISHGFTSDGTRFADTRAWDPSTGTWADETPDGELPVSRCLHGCWWTFDGRLALFGGQTTGVTALADRWLLDRAWTPVMEAQPAARNLYARGRVAEATLILGGQAEDGSYLADGWWLLDTGGAAVALEVEGPMPPGRAGAELVYDHDADRFLLFGGRDVAGSRADLWQLDGVASAVP